MKAMIFAAGLGTRLGDLTKDQPKAMVEVGGKPMLCRVIEKVESIGVNALVINVHHHADVIESYLKKNDNFGLDIRISDERKKLLDTGGGVLAAMQLLEGSEPILLHNADILTDFDIREMLNAHVDSGSDVTLLTSERTTSRYLLFDKDGVMRGWKNEKTGEVKPAGLDESGLEKLAFGGVHIISPAVFPLLEAYRDEHGDVFSITPFYVENCGKLKIKSYRPTEKYRWIDVGKPETLAKARQMFEK